MAEPTVPEHVDVLVVGAGISGIDAAYHLQTECPGHTYAILEGRHALGGTWDLFRYPGIRSDSDMYTLGFPFHPWTGEKSIADGASILAYLHETAEAYGIDCKIRYDHQVVRAEWSTATSTWTVDVLAGPDATPTTLTCGFLYACSGYYSYEGGYQPAFPGTEQYEGEIVHPQAWPEDLDVTGRRIVVIGSGATAVTLVPTLAATAEHVTMLQRSPSYIASLPARDPFADLVRKHLPARVAHGLVKWKNVLLTSAFYQLSRRRPKLVRKVLHTRIAALLPEGFALDPHFTPSYDPWDQRLCLVPDGDLFRALEAGTASIETGLIETFTDDGIRLTDGTELVADLVVSATGLNLVGAGGIDLVVDDEPVELAQTYTYKGHMLSGVPNFAMCLGYTNASWTLRADLTSRAVCRLLNHLRATGDTKAVPTVDPDTIEPRPLLDLDSGYVRRAADRLPKQGSKAPWNLRQNYVLDLLSTRFGAVEESMDLSRPASSPR